MNNKQITREIIRSIFFLILTFSFLSGLLYSQEKKVKVVADKANIYFKPDKRSPVVEIVEKGTVLTLRQTKRVKKIWNYVYFTSKKTGVSKSGYILDSKVERLFVESKAVTLRDRRLESKSNFRQAFWGMSKGLIIGVEGKPSHQEHSGGLEIIGYQQKVAGMKCLIEYIFREDRLIRAKYIFLEKRKYKNQYIADYKRVKDFLAEKHEQVALDNINWLNTMYKENYSKWGIAVSLGHLEYNSLWSTPETEILLKLSGGDNEVSLEVEYTGVRFKDIDKEAKRRPL